MNEQDQKLIKPLADKVYPILIEKLKTQTRLQITALLVEAGYSIDELHKINRQQSSFAVHLDILEKNLCSLVFAKLKETHPQYSLRYGKSWGRDGEILT